MFDELIVMTRELAPRGISAALQHYLAVLSERKSRDDPYPMDSDALKEWHARLLAAWNALAPEDQQIHQAANDLWVARLIEREDQERG